MKQLIVLCCMVAVCRGTFFPPQNTETEALNLCIYSKDPSQYNPKCFTCAKNVYDNALKACVNGTTMPSNITYSSATCMEKNCEINYPKLTDKPSSSLQADSSKFLESLISFFRPKRSVEDNNVAESSRESMLKKEIPGWKIIGEIHVYASDKDFDIDYVA